MISLIIMAGGETTDTGHSEVLWLTQYLQCPLSAAQQQHQHWKQITFQRRAPKWIWKQFLPKLAIDHHCTSSTQGMRVESWARTRPARRGWNFKQANCLPNIGQYNSQFFSLYLPTIRRSVSPIPRWSPPNCRDQFCRSPLTHSASIRRKKGRKKLPHFGFDSWGFWAWRGLWTQACQLLTLVHKQYWNKHKHKQQGSKT